MNRIIKIFILSIALILFYIVLIKDISIGECLIRRYIGIKCPGCGLTRACNLLLELQIINAIKMNYLIIPLFFITLIGGYNIIIDIIKNSYKLEKMLNKILEYYKIIIIILVISLVINNLNPLV